MQSSLKMNRMCIGMRKLKISLLLLCSMFFINGAVAQNKPLACQGEAAAGINWQNGRWVTTKFETKKFVLVQAGNLLTKESVAKAFESTDINSANCSYSYGEITCSLSLGRILYFNPVSLRGATSALYGSTYAGNQRDSVAVEVFSCTPF